MFSSLENMHEVMINNWNSVIKSDKDIVYIVGDFSFGGREITTEIIRRLNGRKILIRGNHDERFSTRALIEMGMYQVYDELIIDISDNKVLLKHYPYAKGWFSQLYYKYANKKWKNYFALYPVDKGLWHIHGHHHGGDLVKGRQINVSCETIQYIPIDEYFVADLIKEGNKSKGWFETLIRFITSRFETKRPKANPQN